MKQNLIYVRFIVYANRSNRDVSVPLYLWRSGFNIDRLVFNANISSISTISWHMEIRHTILLSNSVRVRGSISLLFLPLWKGTVVVVIVW